jgi:4-hydroxybenzoate polyprenyltransferase
MNLPSPTRQAPLHRLKLFLALSRTPHGVLDMATPAFAALLWLGHLPSPWVTVVGVVTAFAGYTAVYALNDIVDYRSDRQQYERGCFGDDCTDLDALLVRHPMAQGLLGLGEGVLWTAGWAAAALLGAWWLNPVCVWIFLAGCLMEALYCLLWRITPLRTLISGGVKTLGAVAAVFAVDPTPAPHFVTTLFLCLFFWEIGGQNVPNDWTDIEGDRQAGARTIPVDYGTDAARLLVAVTAGLATGLVLLLYAFSGGEVRWFHYLAAAAATAVVFAWPALQLYRQPCPENAMALFNRASYFPLSMLAVTLFIVLAG